MHVQPEIPLRQRKRKNAVQVTVHEYMISTPRWIFESFQQRGPSPCGIPMLGFGNLLNGRCAILLVFTEVLYEFLHVERTRHCGHLIRVVQGLFGRIVHELVVTVGDPTNETRQLRECTIGHEATPPIKGFQLGGLLHRRRNLVHPGTRAFVSCGAQKHAMGAV